MGVPTASLVLMALLFVGHVMCSDEAPEILSESMIPLEEESVESAGRQSTVRSVPSLEYKPIKPSYQSSGSNVGQIVPPGQPWPATPEGYANFSQIPSGIIMASPTAQAAGVQAPQVQASSDQVIQLDFTNPNTDVTKELQEALESQLVGVNVQSSQQQTIPISLNILPPPNSGLDYINTLQDAIRAIMAKLEPLAGLSIKLRYTKSSTGAVTNIGITTNVVIPATVKPTLPPSSVPEIDLTQSTAGLSTSLQSIISSELLQKGYIANSNVEQSFSLSFSVLPPEGATQDYVKLNVIRPLQQVIRQIPGGSLASVAVSTQESNNKVVRQTVNFTIKVKPAVSTTTVPPTTPKPTPPSTTPAAVQIPKDTVETSSTIDLSNPNLTLDLLKSKLKQGLISALKPNAGSETIGFKFVIPGSAVNSLSTMANTVGSVLLNLEPTGQILPILVPTTLPNGNIVFVIYLQLPSIKGTNAYKEVEKNQPIVSEQNINLDEKGATIEGQVKKALINGLSVDDKKPKYDTRGRRVDLNIYNPPNELPKEKSIIDDVETDLKKSEPTGNVVSSKINPEPKIDQPDGNINFLVPSVSGSKTAEIIGNTIKIPTIDINQQGINLVNTIKSSLRKNLLNLGALGTKGSQLFNLKFRLNPYDTQGSITQIVNALSKVDSAGVITSKKIETGIDGLEYLDISYLIPKLEDWKINKVTEAPEVVTEAVVSIDARNPMYRLLEKVINVIGTAEDYVKGVREGQVIKLPLNFRIKDTEGMSDSKVSLIISRLLPYLKKYIDEVLPDGQILSMKTRSDDESDDVYLRYVVRTPYSPNDEIVIEDVVKKPTTTTTAQPWGQGIFGLFGR